MKANHGNAFDLSRCFGNDWGSSMSRSDEFSPPTLYCYASALGVLTRAVLVTALACLNLGTRVFGGEQTRQNQDSEAVQVFKQFIESPPIIKSLKAKIEFRGISMLFMASDITNLPSLVSRLRSPSERDEISRYVGANLSRSTRGMLSNYDGGVSVELALRHELARDLNRLISRPLYDTQRFEAIRLSAVTRDLLRGNPKGQDELKLNRSLIQEAYPREISFVNHPSLKEVFVEIRWQSNAFYVKTAPGLGGLDDPFVRPVGALDRINGALPITSIAGGRYGDNLWCIANQGFQTDRLSPELWSTYGTSNRNPISVELPLSVASRILNFGLPSEKIGALKWSGSIVRGADHFGNEFVANLDVGIGGRPKGVSLVYPAFQFRPDNILRREVGITYEYTGRVADWRLPTRICADDSDWTAEILTIELSREQQARQWFDHRSLLNRRSGVVVVTNRRDEKLISQAKYRDLTDSLQRIAGLWVSKEQLRACVFFSFCALTASIVTAGVAIDRKKKAKLTTQNL